MRGLKDEIRPGQSYVFYYAPAWTKANAGLLTAMEINGRKVTYLSP